MHSLFAAPLIIGTCMRSFASRGNVDAFAPIQLVRQMAIPSSSQSKQQTNGNHRSSSVQLSASSVPSLVVFDLDNTVWTPELYTLRKLERQNIQPRAHQDVKLFPATKKIIDVLRTDDRFAKTKFAVASRTKSVEWAHDLLKQFGLTDFFDYIEIFPGDKSTHFRNLQSQSGVDYKDMIFFDDARDGRYGNCVPVSELGVLSVHCPNGLDFEQWEKSLEYYEDRASSSAGAIVEWDGKITDVQASAEPDSSERYTGEVKVVNAAKRFGFISCRGKKDTFFHFSALNDQNSEVEVGDKVSFSVIRDRKNGKLAAASVDLTNSTGGGSPADGGNTVELKAFSMNLPFAALLANEYKILETRNGTMFKPYPPGTKMLLHVGQRTYPDGDRHIEVMKSGGLDDKEIQRLKSLPKGYGRGMAVAIVELGETFETTLEERSEPEFQRFVAAFGTDSGMRATVIRRAAYLKKPLKVSGQGGVFKVKINKDVVPDGWIDEPSLGNKKIIYSVTV